jgi:hypothetical protein
VHALMIANVPSTAGLTSYSSGRESKVHGDAV